MWERVLVTAALGALLSIGCDGGGASPPGGDGGTRREGGGGDGRFGEPPPSPVTDSLTTDSRGGVLAITDPESPAYGTTVHVRPGSRMSEIALQVRAIEMPEANRRVLAGPVVEITPRDDLLTALDADVWDRTELVMPVYEGPTTNVRLARYDEVREDWRDVDSSQFVWTDPVAETFSAVQGRIVWGGIYAPVLRVYPTVGVISEVHDEYDVEVIASRSLTESARGFPFRTAAPGEVRMPSDELRSSVPLELMEGEYVLRVAGRSGEDPRCAIVTVPEDGFLTVTDATPRCDGLPEAALEASTQLVRVGESIDLTARATSASGEPLDWYLNDTGGTATPDEGTTTSGGTVTAEWTATRVGEYELSFTAYDETGMFAESRLRVRVRGNDPPEITSFLATPVQLETGAPEGSRDSVPPMSVGDAEMGLSLLTVEATDPDGDPIRFLWYHGLPGNYFDPVTGTQLGRGFPSGLVTDPTTELPFTGASVLYMAPPEEFLCDSMTAPLGYWLGLHVTASDGEGYDRSWLMVGAECLEPEPGAEGFLRCLYQIDGRDQCFHGDAAAPGARNGETDCLPMGGDWGEGRCPAGGAACVQDVGGFEYVFAYYDERDYAGGRDACSGSWTTSWGG